MNTCSYKAFILELSSRVDQIARVAGWGAIPTPSLMSSKSTYKSARRPSGSLFHTREKADESGSATGAPPCILMEVSAGCRCAVVGWQISCSVARRAPPDPSLAPLDPMVRHRVCCLEDVASSAVCTQFYYFLYRARK